MVRLLRLRARCWSPLPAEAPASPPSPDAPAPTPRPPSPRQVHRLLAGGSAGCIACACTYPLDLVRTRLSTQTTVQVYSGVWGTVGRIVRTEGILGARPSRASRAAQDKPPRLCRR